MSIVSFRLLAQKTRLTLFESRSKLAADIFGKEMRKSEMAITVPGGYDPTTLNHWLWFKFRCHEGSPTEFQRLFEDVMKRYKPEFMQIRPYGNIGDRKVDGLLRVDSSIFQVYSPDDFTQAKLLKKINEDLDGAVEQWGDEIKSWTFVYNVRRGLAPDVPKILNKKQKQYPHIKIDDLSSDGLWEILRTLPLQQRSEVLGAPSEYKGFFSGYNNQDMSFQTSSNANEPKDSWLVLVQDLLNPIDCGALAEAIKPEFILGAPIFLRPASKSWKDASVYQKSVMSEIFEKCRDSFPPRFAVFSLAPIPLIVHLGFLLTSNVPTRYFKLHLKTQSWLWPVEQIDTNYHVSGIPDNTVDAECEVIIRVSISDRVEQYETDEVVASSPVQVDISVDEPSLTWVQSENQVIEFAEIFRNVLAKVRKKVKHCNCIHLFMAVPAPIALIAGQQINPRMNPPINLYEYSRNTKPRYQYTFTLE